MQQCEGLNICKPSINYKDIYRSDTIIPPKHKTLLYAQAACTTTEDYLKRINLYGVSCSVLGLFMCVFWRFTITHIQNEQKIDEKLIDLKEVTIEDYSIRGSISRELYHHALESTKQSDDVGEEGSPDAERESVKIRRVKKYLIE